MGVIIIYIGIIRPLSHFEYINFKASLVIKIINFNEIKICPISCCLVHKDTTFVFTNILQSPTL
jgi:hypothetical protein